jgi:hypothetical protein
MKITPAAESYLIEWCITVAIGGGICLVPGCLIGWIIWRNGRKMAQSVEEKTRGALADYEKTSDEISRIKSELAAGGR